MPALKRLAAVNHCTVEDDRFCTTIKVEANDGWSWDDGERSCQWFPYGSEGSYLPEWRGTSRVQQRPELDLRTLDARFDARIGMVTFGVISAPTLTVPRRRF